jgi:hypothetical protein
MKFILVVATMAIMLTMTSSVQARLLASTLARQAKTCTNLGDCQSAQFCGTDNHCHYFSCPTWFQKGGWNETSIGSTQLACQDYSTGDQDENYAVVYGCQAIFGPVVPAAKGAAQPFNRKCSASIGNQVFECYDLKPSTDFGAFMSHADLAPESCIDQNDGSVLKASFIYQTRTQSGATSSINSGGVSGFSLLKVSSGFHSTGYAVTPPADTFDASRAPFTMRAISTTSASGIIQSRTGVYDGTTLTVLKDLGVDPDSIYFNHMESSPLTLAGKTESGAHNIKPAYGMAVLVGFVALLF